MTAAVSFWSIGCDARYHSRLPRITHLPSYRAATTYCLQFPGYHTFCLIS